MFGLVPGTYILVSFKIIVFVCFGFNFRLLYFAFSHRSDQNTEVQKIDQHHRKRNITHLLVESARLRIKYRPSHKLSEIGLKLIFLLCTHAKTNIFMIRFLCFGLREDTFLCSMHGMAPWDNISHIQGSTVFPFSP